MKSITSPTLFYHVYMSVGCCVYQKPRVFGESSSEDDSDECESCSGHKPNCYKQADNPESKTISKY